jgi:hypothetical protein
MCTFVQARYCGAVREDRLGEAAHRLLPFHLSHAAMIDSSPPIFKSIFLL